MRRVWWCQYFWLLLPSRDAAGNYGDGASPPARSFCGACAVESWLVRKNASPSPSSTVLCPQSALALSGTRFFRHFSKRVVPQNEDNAWIALDFNFA